MDTRLEIAHRLTQRLTQQQLRFVRLLELNAPEIDDAVERELEANPALTIEHADPTPDLSSDAPDSNTPTYFNFGSRRLNADPDTPSFTPRDNSETLADILIRQISERDVSPEVAETARYIVGNLDSNGWLTRSLPRMLDDLAINRGQHVDDAIGREALDLVRSLDPAGVGAENLADTLLLQLRRLPESQRRDDAIGIISKFFREYHMRHSHKIISGLGISRERLDDANALILSLNPKPGAPYGGAEETAAAIIIPDFIVTDDDGELSIQLNGRTPELTIEESFAEAMREMEQQSKNTRKGSEFISSRFNDARDFIQIIQRRNRTLMSVMTAILSYQKEYFRTGDVFTLRPMMLKDLAATTGLDISVISRATANKSVAMPWGEVLPLRSFFSGKVNAPAPGHAKPSPENETDDNDLTNRQIQAAISRLISKEDPGHPLSDERLRAILEQQGYDISRRTVAKYRDRAGIPIARLRKKF